MKDINKNTMEVLKSRYFMEGENKWEDIVERIITEMEKIDKKDIEQTKIALANMNFIPGGRILRNIGRIKGSMMNCNCLGLGDSIETIGDCVKNSLIIWSYGGGVGINFSSIRPKGTPLSTKGGYASGLISYLEAIDHLAGTIESGGQRRAAGIAVCNVRHPEILEFITVKKKLGIINHFNLSVGITEQFLEQVEKNGTWDLKFGGRIYKTIKAMELWEKILEGMLDNGEPGLLNWDNLTKNNSYYFSPIACVNPCSEQPLSVWGSCDLGAINLTNFILPNGKTNWNTLENTIKIGVRFLDNIIDLNYYPISELERESIRSRKIGLGIMGLGDYLLLKKIKYGSPKSLIEIEKLFKFIRNKAYETSIELAKEKTAFPAYDRIAYSKASFIRKLPPTLRMKIKGNGIRNCNLITCAPTGTTSLLPNVSPGIEPIPYKAYKRHDRISDRIYIHPLYKKCLKEAKRAEELDYFTDIDTLTPEEHLDVQSIIQKYVDSGISKTINLPEDATTDQLGKLLLEYIRDLKGVTVYRDGSREGQPLNKLTEEEVRNYINKEEDENFLVEDDVKCNTGICEI